MVRDYEEHDLRGSGLWGTWATVCGTMSNMIPGIGTMGSMSPGHRDYGEPGLRESGLWGAWAPGIGTMGSLGSGDRDYGDPEPPGSVPLVPD